MRCGASVLAAAFGLASMTGLYPTSAFAEEDRWRGRIAPYFWFSGLDGRAATLPGVPPVDVEKSFREIAEELDFGFLLFGEVRKGRFGFQGDFVYTSLTSEEVTPSSVRKSLGTDSLSLTALGTYRPLESKRASLDFLAGARLWSVDTRLDAGLQGQPGLVLEAEESWVDPVVGLSGRTQLGSSSLFLVGTGTVGAGASNLTWELWGALGYYFNRKLGLVGGYRTLSVDYDNDGYLLDITQHGFLFGLIYQFGAPGQ